ncbi:hypothetical protein EST38_g7590 [Candolleomyces aberdarensis]|uniref:Peptidyl-prolyl cis-trans isomerase n=1 Tax=Candolleomyces aberdarensis TaxID=2316362 RepID=A0A4Q2DI45_9AGAR|nr:hypothetical protein EST38_g7590 [Candolleomyces aberdarensis]
MATSPSTQRPIVFMDIQIGETPAGRLKFELFSDIVPKYASRVVLKENLVLIEPQNRRKLQAIMHRRAQGSKLYVSRQLNLPGPPDLDADLLLNSGGDFLKGDGTGTFSIYGDKFADENFIEKHSGPGLLSMANSGPNTNGCQFFITTATCDFLDGKHVVFGKVLEGMLTLRKIENVATGPNNRPKLVVKITECGEM